MFKKILVIAFILSSFFVSSPVSAQNASSQIPSLNPFCWKKKDCFVMRAKYITGTATQADLENGFVTGASASPCVGGTGDDEWGRCLPAGQSRTEISFGGKDKFSNIGEFILLMYKYLVTIASIVAVIMVILAGVQWVTSGGNSERISSAKKRISGAIVGLFIAYMSYFILNTINPALVNFRLPQVWLVRPQYLIPQFCKQIAKTESGKPLTFLWYANYDDQNSPVDIKKAGKDELTYGTQKDGNNNFMFYCGRRFLAEGSGTQTCFGGLCPSEPGNRQSCTKEDPKAPMSCKNGELAIHFSINIEAFDLEEQVSQSVDKLNDGIFITKAMETAWLKDTQVFRGVCKDGDKTYLANDGGAKDWIGGEGRKFGPNGGAGSGIEKTPYWEYQSYYTKLIDFQDMGWDCNHGGELVGYLLRVETHARESTWEKYGPSFKDLIPGYAIGSRVYTFFGGGESLPNLSVGYDRNTGQAVFGTFSDDVKTINNYIPIDLLKEGMSLDVPLTIGKIIRIKGKSGENPSDFIENMTPLVR